MNQPIRIGVLGMGGRGRYFAKSWPKNPGCRVVAACERDPRVLDLSRRIVTDPGIRWYDDMHRMLAEGELDAVVVATNDKAHAQGAIAVLEAGKHLFLEKPMAQSIQDCDAVIDAWRKTDRVFMVGLELRYCSLCQIMKQILDRGDIGAVKIAYAVDNVSVGGDYYFHGPRRHQDYVLSLALEKGTHTLDLMNWFIGAQPVRVYGEGGLDVFGQTAPPDLHCPDCPVNQECPYAILNDQFKMDYGDEKVRMPDGCVYGRDVDVHDNLVLSVRYDNGAKMTYTECHFTPDYNRHFTLIGTKGRMVGFYNNEQEFRIELTYRHSQRRDVIYPPKVEGGHGGGDPMIQKEFLRRIEKGERCCPGVAGARNSAAIAIAAHHACLSGLPQAIIPLDLSLEAGLGD
jgi:predicted dehydrogenase